MGNSNPKPCNSSLSIGNCNPKPRITTIEEDPNQWHDFPPDVQLEILKRLPTQTLLRCLSTCKSMFSIITSPSFMVSSLHLQNHNIHGYIYSYFSNGELGFFLIKNENLGPFFSTKRTQLCCPVDVTHFLIGSCNGLVCFSNRFHPNPSLVLWNPFLGIDFTLLMPPLPTTQRTHELGFGFDLSRLDYRVVRVGIYNNSIWADIYTLYANTWKQVSKSISQPVLRIMGQGVCINGVLHWILKFCSNNKYSILMFDLGKEVFGEMGIPPNSVHEYMTLTSLKISGEDKLVLYHNDHKCNVWVMEKYGEIDSWMKLCTIELNNGGGKILHIHDDEIIVSTCCGGQLISYNIKTPKQQSIVFHQNLQVDYVGPYMESLVFLRPYYKGDHKIASKRRGKEVEEEDKSSCKKEMDHKAKMQESIIRLCLKGSR